MFTETELREALQHSAGRADDLDVATPRATRRWLLPVAAAATVAALAVGVVAFVGGSADRGPAPIGAAPPLARVDLVDRAVAGVDADYLLNDASVRATGGQHISRALGAEPTDGTASLTVLPAGLVDRDRVEQGRRVSIAGTTGWFAQRAWFELDGQEGAAPGQDDPLPQWSVAFRTPGGDWAFAVIDTLKRSARDDGTYDPATVNDPERIAAAYDSLKIRWSRDAARQPLRFDVLPPHLRLQSASYSVRANRVMFERLRFVQRDDTELEVRWSARGNRVEYGSACTADPSTPPTCTTASRTLAGGTVHVDAFGTQVGDSTSVLDGVTVKTDPDDYVSFEQAVTP